MVGGKDTSISNVTDGYFTIKALGITGEIVRDKGHDHNVADLEDGDKVAMMDEFGRVNDSNALDGKRLSAFDVSETVVQRYANGKVRVGDATAPTDAVNLRVAEVIIGEAIDEALIDVNKEIASVTDIANSSKYE